MGIYYRSAGRNGNLLLNVGPDRDGLVPDADLRRFRDSGFLARFLYALPESTVGKRDVRQRLDQLVGGGDFNARQQYGVCLCRGHGRQFVYRGYIQ